MVQVKNISRRTLFAAAGSAAVAGLTTSTFSKQRTKAAQTIPLKIGHRAASMQMVGDFGVFKLARQIPGLLGVELQVAAGEPNLRDWDAVRRYKREASRWGMMIPSLAGVWNRGVSIYSPAAGLNLIQAIRSAELLGASVLLVAFFRDNAPDMSDETSYGPIVNLLKGCAPQAADAGVTLGLENSLSPADNARLVDLVDEPAVKVYYDVHNMAYYGHGAEAIPGIQLLGKDRICMVHVKNNDKLIEESGRVDWKAAFETFNEIGYDGWYVFESRHTDRQQVVDATTRNIKYLEKLCRMPEA